MASRKRPNAFVSLQVRNAEVISAVEKAQNESKLPKKLLPSPKLSHITLCVLRIEGEAEESRAKNALLEVASTWKSGRIQLKFDGIDFFDDFVAFAKVKGDLDKLLALRAQMMPALEAYEEDFNPHLTLAKGKEGDFGHAFASSLESNFGEETFSKVELCWMGMEKDKDYYQVIIEEQFA